MRIFKLLYNKFIYRVQIKRKLSKVGGNFKLGYSSELINPNFFIIGDNFYSGPYGYFVTNKNNIVTIGNHVMLGSHCKIIGGNHDYAFTKNHMYFNNKIDHMNSFITIEDGVWIGAGSTILSNAYISEGVAIGASALVNTFIPPYCMAVGIPAKKFKRRFNKKEDLIKIIKNTNSQYTFNDINTIYKKYNIEYE